MDRVDTGRNCGRRVWKSEKGGRTEAEGGSKHAPWWKQDCVSGRTVDSELYAQDLWKQHSHWKTRPPGWKSPRAGT